MLKDLWFWTKVVFWIGLFIFVATGDLDHRDGIYDEQASFYENASECYPDC